jgi:hypothetical protein
MDKLTDYKPLETVKLPGLGELDCSGLILVVGPNSSGKTQFLQDLYRTMIGEARDLVVAQVLRIRKPDYESLFKCLTDEGFIRVFANEQGNDMIRPMTSYTGVGQGPNDILIDQARSMHQNYPVELEGKTRKRVDFLNYFGRMLVTGLFLQNRLTLTDRVSAFDYENQPPQNDLHALYVNDDAKAKLASEVSQTFGRAVWIDGTRGQVLCLRASDTAETPSPEDRLSPRMMSAFRTMETEGDGLKSYVATCIALLLGRRPVCIVDEPEMCLHPPQAYNLGRFIGRYGTGEDNVTFVATHSSHILRGVIQTTTKLQIIRLTRVGSIFEAHLVPAAVLVESIKKPTVRAEAVLDGIFAQAVVVIEADGDRSLYQAVWETLADEFKVDIHFTAVGGTGGIADTCKLYRTLRIPAAVIADLDALTDVGRLNRIMSALTEDERLVSELTAKARELANALKRLPPTISESEARSAISSTLAEEYDWDEDTDGPLRRRLLQIASDLDRMGRIKRGGVAALPVDLRAITLSIIDELANLGLFLVPVGELEGWLETYGNRVSKKEKWAWANEAALLVHKAGPQEDDVWGFIRRVGQHLRSRLSM